MSFYDEPEVDDNAKRSEESVNVVRSLFTRRNGFITREENPDYGVDLDVELMTAGVGASSQKFPIQIKSAIKVDKVKLNGDEVISYTFKTSRLGYLAKRPPAYGIFTLYDDTNQICYFDYVEDIIRRLDDHPDREGWREQKTVNILFPFQVLNAAVLPSLHERFVKRHKYSLLMLQEHGAAFNIPNLESNTYQAEPSINFKDPQQVADFLELHGNWLYNESEIVMLNHLLGIVSRDRLNHSTKLIFLAAITYTQTGNILDAEYFLRKARKSPEVMRGEGATMIELAAARVEFMKGNTDYEYFLNRFRSVVDQTESPVNKFTIKVDILFFEMTKGLETNKFPDDFAEQLEKLEKEIAAVDMPAESKHMIKCHHADCQFHFASRSQLNLYKEVKKRDAQGNEMPMNERLSRFTVLEQLISSAEQAVYDAYQYGRENELSNLNASAAHQMGQHFFAQRMNLFVMGELQKMAQDKTKFITSFETHQNYSLVAYNEFIKLNLFHTAHEALSIAYEINQLCLYLTGTLVGKKSGAELLEIMRQIESAFDLTPFQSRVDKMFNA